MYEVWGTFVLDFLNILNEPKQTCMKKLQKYDIHKYVFILNVCNI